MLLGPLHASSEAKVLTYLPHRGLEVDRSLEITPAKIGHLVASTVSPQVPFPRGRTRRARASRLDAAPFSRTLCAPPRVGEVVPRQAHNLEVAGSTPAPATTAAPTERSGPPPFWGLGGTSPEPSGPRLSPPVAGFEGVRERAGASA